MRDPFVEGDCVCVLMCLFQYDVFRGQQSWEDMDQ